MSEKIKILNSLLEELATLSAVSSASHKERINGEKTLTFSFPIRKAESALINDNSIFELNGDYYDIAYYKKEQQSDGRLMVSVEAEHVSYRLNNPQYNVEFFTMTGTPTAILTAILDGTDFTLGTVEFSDTVTFSLQEAASRRALLMQFVAYLGGELDFYGFEISVLQQRGSTTPKALRVGKDITVISKAVDKRRLDAQGNPIISYTCGVYKGATIELGDIVTLDYDKLDIDNVSLRVISKTYDPYNPNNVTIEVGNYTNSLEDDLYRIETQTVIKDKLYNGTRIGPEYGFEVIRSDKYARAYFNSTTFAMQQGDGTGNNWTDVIYFDPLNRKYKITGDVDVEGSLASDADFTDSLYAEQGDVSELTVDWVKTSRRAWKYLNEDTSDDNYVEIFGQTIRLVTSSVKQPLAAVQLYNRYGDPLYWNGDISQATLNADGWPELNGTRLYTTKKASDWPVLTYDYDEIVKAEWSFSDVDGIIVPQIVMGAGSGVGDSEKSFIWKDTDGLHLRYVNSNGENVDLILGEEGVVLTPFDVRAIDIYTDGFATSYGGNSLAYRWEKDGGGRITKLTNVETGEEVPVTWHDEEM